MSLPAVLLFCLAQFGGVYSNTLGASECRCATSSWSGFAALQADLTARGYPANYGLQGCQDYDVGFAPTGCSGTNPPSYCSSFWCYVDNQVCGVNATQCKAGGHTLNDVEDPSCRSREMHRSGLVTAVAFYSYATCGYLDSYDTSRIRGLIAGKKVFATTTIDLPYTNIEYGVGVNETTPLYSGVEVDFFLSAMEEFDTTINIAMEDTWATEESRARFSSSYTAVVNDVAVGRYDIAVGDFWVTSERVLMTPFLPGIRSDLFFLVAFTSEGATTFLSMLSNPFKPFSGQAWGLVVGVTVFTAFAMAFLEVHDSDEFRIERKKNKSNPLLKRVLKSLFLAMASLVKGESKYSTASTPTKLCYLVFQLFLLVVLASYTANLASLLVVTKIETGVQSIEEAIALNLKICIPSAVEKAVLLLHPSANLYVYGGSSSDFARHMHAGLCDVAVIHQKRISQLHGGRIQEADCAALESGSLTAEEAVCELDHLGKERDDCKIQSVGEAILSIPVAFPVRQGSELWAPLTWALTKAQNSGRWEGALQQNENLFPQSRCKEPSLASEQLGLEAFAGISFFVAVITVIALVLEIWQERRDALREAQSKEDPDAEAQAAQETLQDVDSSLVALAEDIQRLLAEKRTAQQQLERAHAGASSTTGSSKLRAAAAADRADDIGVEKEEGCIIKSQLLIVNGSHGPHATARPLHPEEEIALQSHATATDSYNGSGSAHSRARRDLILGKAVDAGEA